MFLAAAGGFVTCYLLRHVRRCLGCDERAPRPPTSPRRAKKSRGGGRTGAARTCTAETGLEMGGSPLELGTASKALPWMLPSARQTRAMAFHELDETRELGDLLVE